MLRFALLLLGLIATLIFAGCSSTGKRLEVRSEVTALVTPRSDDAHTAGGLALQGPLSDAERTLLLSALGSEASIKQMDFIAVLTALVADAHPETVERLCGLLHEQENRYYALALGAIGDPAAIPALRRRCRTTTYSYVYNDCRFALQMLGDRSSLDRLPDATIETHSPLRIRATLDRDTVGEGDAFEVTVTMRNGGESPLALFFPIYSISRCISADGDHLIEMQGATIFYDVKEQNFRVLLPGEEIRYTERYEFVRRSMGIERKFLREMQLPGEVLCLIQTNGAHQGRRLAVYEPGRRIVLRLAYEYDGMPYRDDADRLGIEHLVTGIVVSNPIEVTCVAEGVAGARVPFP
ncbi:hypothetical protein OT109_04575 [Phycisphaeraceae bacterium D3-23]